MFFHCWQYNLSLLHDWRIFRTISRYFLLLHAEQSGLYSNVSLKLISTPTRGALSHELQK